jgi:hypothetical protein
MPADARIRYVGLDRPLLLGAKRNLACELARGDVIVHWDDDDWCAAHRLSYELAELTRHGAEICGAGRLLYLDPACRAAWLYAHPGRRPPWVAGNTLCYTRDAWRRSPFPEIDVGEDMRFIRPRRRRRIVALDDHRFIVGLLHPGNASPKDTGGPWWSPVGLGEVAALLGHDMARYLDG